MFSMFGKKSTMLKAPVEAIVVGLGNPGSRYDHSRHNAGFITVNMLAEKLNVKIDRIKFKSETATTVINDKGVLLMKPSTFMNLSGEAVVEAMNFYKIPAEKVIVIYDDISLDPGRLRIRMKGSHGGHNGMKNIIQLSGKDTFPRIKMGVGERPNPQWDLASWVLSPFTKAEREALDEAAEKACAAVPLMLDGKFQEAMNKFNS